MSGVAAAPAAGHDAFDGIPEAELEPHLARLERRRYPPGAVLLRQGAEPGEMFLVRSGWAEVVLASRSAERLLARLGPGDSVGEMSLFTGEAVSATVRVAGGEPLEALVLHADDLRRLAEAVPAIYRNLGRQLAHRLARTNVQSLPHEPGRVTLLVDDGAPRQLGPALAASLAWHVREPVVLLVVGDDPPACALPAASLTAPGAGAPARAIIASTRAERLASAVEHARIAFGHVLVLTGDPAHGRQLAEPARLTVRLAGPAAPRGRELTLRAFTPERLRPALADGSVDVPAPRPREEEAIAAGALPLGGPAGDALGRLARRLAGLRVGLVLGAGGARGYAHIGVLAELARRGLPLDAMAGTSVGAMLVPGWAIGIPAPQLAGLLDRATLSLRLRPTPWSLVSTAGLRRFLQQQLGALRFEDLPLPVGLVTTDLQRACEVVFDRGPVVPAMLASAAIPGVMRPLDIGGRLLVDGGVLNPVPADVAASLGADVVVAVRLAAPQAPTERAAAAQSRPGTVLLARMAMDAIDLMQARMAAHPTEATTIDIEPDFAPEASVSMHRFRDGRQFLPLGEAAAAAAWPRLQAALPWIRPG